MDQQNLISELYIKYCSAHKRIMDRNNDLLAMLNDIETQAAYLAAKSERMKLLTSQHRSYLAHMCSIRKGMKEQETRQKCFDSSEQRYRVGKCDASTNTEPYYPYAQPYFLYPQYPGYLPGYDRVQNSSRSPDYTRSDNSRPRSADIHQFSPYPSSVNLPHFPSLIYPFVCESPTRDEEIQTPHKPAVQLGISNRARQYPEDKITSTSLHENSEINHTKFSTQGNMFTPYVPVPKSHDYTPLNAEENMDDSLSQEATLLPDFHYISVITEEKEQVQVNETSEKKSIQQFPEEKLAEHSKMNLVDESLQLVDQTKTIRVVEEQPMDDMTIDDKLVGHVAKTVEDQKETLGTLQEQTKSFETDESEVAGVIEVGSSNDDEAIKEQPKDLTIEQENVIGTETVEETQKDSGVSEEKSEVSAAVDQPKIVGLVEDRQDMDQSKAVLLNEDRPEVAAEKISEGDLNAIGSVEQSKNIEAVLEQSKVFEHIETKSENVLEAIPAGKEQPITVEKQLNDVTLTNEPPKEMQQTVIPEHESLIQDSDISSPYDLTESPQFTSDITESENIPENKESSNTDSSITFIKSPDAPIDAVSVDTSEIDDDVEKMMTKAIGPENIVQPITEEIPTITSMQESQAPVSANEDKKEETKVKEVERSKEESHQKIPLKKKVEGFALESDSESFNLTDAGKLKEGSDSDEEFDFE